MPSTNTPPTISHHPGPAAQSQLDALCDAYADAYGVVGGGEKVTAFRARAEKQFERPGFALVTATIDNQLVGFAFGYTVQPGSKWWEGLEPEPSADFVAETGRRTFVLSEIEVRRAWQSSGVGHALHNALLASRTEERATLATGPDAPAQPIYERWGWQKVGRVPGANGEYYSAYDLFVVGLPVAKTP